MDKPWYKKIFSGSAKSAAEAQAGQDIQTRADRGDAEAQFNLGLKYANGEESARDYAQAARWYLKAADQSHTLAQFNLGVMYDAGQGVVKDEAQAGLWFNKAANQGDAGAQFKLGKRQHHASVRGVPGEAIEARIEAYKWLQLATTQGYKDRDASLSTLILQMSRADVADGMRRVQAFRVEKPKAPGAP